MKVKMLVSLSGSEGAVHAGDTHECDAAEGARLIDAGIAEPVGAAATSRESKTPTEKRQPATKKK